MAKPKVLLLGTIDHAQEAWKSVAEIAEVVQPKSTNRSEFLEECRTGRLNGVVAAYRTFMSISITGVWDEELVQALPDSFKMVAHNGAGYDQLQPDALSSRSIIATNVPTAVDDSTADTGIFLLLGALRNLNSSMFALREKGWRGDPAPALGHDPQGKLLGIIGMGGIGRNMAQKCRAFGMKIQYHNRKRLASVDLEAGAEYVSFDELLKTSDVISVHVPLNKHTRHLLSSKQFACMKKGVVIVNTARGAVIDEAALVKALDDGIVASAGLDVFEEEPQVHEGLLRNEKVLLLPHMGTWSIETQIKMEEWCIGNVRCFLEYQQGDMDKLKELSVVAEQKGMVEDLLNA